MINVKTVRQPLYLIRGPFSELARYMRVVSSLTTGPPDPSRNPFGGGECSGGRIVIHISNHKLYLKLSPKYNQFAYESL